MQKSLKYAIFRTKWGYFGLVATENELNRTCLPLSKPERVKSRLLKNLSPANQISSIEHRASRIEFDKNLFKALQEQITAYFEGVSIDFMDEPIVVDQYSFFCRSVLSACRKVGFGQVITYSALAEKLGQPKAARAVGNALAKNPLPLIVPCHRVIRCDGQMGGFSAPGGTNMKKRLLELERQAIGLTSRLPMNLYMKMQ
jgi:O-6-methylguanine DNA methyltransferase